MIWTKKVFLQLFSVAVVLLSAFGFLFKLAEFIQTLARGDIINFAIVPVTVYLVVGIGFFLLFLWSIARGHLRNIEEPKYRMLEQEREYRERGI